MKNVNDFLPVEDAPVQKYKHVFATGDRVVITATGQKAKITSMGDFNRTFVLTDTGFPLQCKPEELEPEGFGSEAGADKVQKNDADPLPLGPFIKSRKTWRVGDTFKNSTGDVATVTEIKAGKVFYTFAGGHGEMLNG